MTRPDDQPTPPNRPEDLPAGTPADDAVELGWGQDPADAVDSAGGADAGAGGASASASASAGSNGAEPGASADASADPIGHPADGADAAAAAAEAEDSGDGVERDTRSMKTVPPALWVWFAAALLLVAGVGFIAGDRLGGTAGGDGVNLAGASAGTDDSGPVAKEDGTFDASIMGPRQGAAVATMDDINEVHRRTEADPFALGAVDAPVVMTVFSDFECPFCARFATDTQPNLIRDYVDAGLVRIEWNDAAASGGAAEQAAQAGRAAAAQGKFWEFQAAAFDAAIAKGNGHPEFTVDELVDIARTAGVEDLDLFTKQVEDGTWKKPVQEALAYSSSIGVRGTPQFVIGTTPLSGALPEVNFRDTIELELMKAARAQNQE